MAENNPSSPSPSMPSTPTLKRYYYHTFNLIIIILVPAILSLFLYQPKIFDFDPAPLPHDYSYGPSISVPEKHGRILEKTERLGEGILHGPEDLAYESETRYLYTGCGDGWIKRVNLDSDPEFKVENWVRTGEHGRPLGLVFGLNGELIVADAYEGLLKINPDRTIELLANEAEGIKFGLTDGVDVAKDGTIYFTDASYKYNFENHMLDTFEARPHGRLMSFDPSTKQTTVLVRDLYFANGVSVAPDQNSLIYCETPMRRCKRYHIHGEKKGTVENFIDNLPGLPDNIRYDGQDHYWIGLPTGRTISLDIIMTYPIIRKIIYVAEQFVTVPTFVRDSGVVSVALDGRPIALYSDPKLIITTGGLKIGNYLYYGSIVNSYISRIDLTKFSATRDE